MGESPNDQGSGRVDVYSAYSGEPPVPADPTPPAPVPPPSSDPKGCLAVLLQLFGSPVEGQSKRGKKSATKDVEENPESNA